VRALILGAGGQLGTSLAELVGAESALTRAQAPITEPQALDAVIRGRRPDVVFNCAAYNAVDQAESHPALARAVNSDGAANVAESCTRHHARLVHFSTNFVFDGALGRPYVESDPPGPLSVYGASKLEGEMRVLEIAPGALVIRTAALFGDRGSAIKGGSFPERILSRALRDEPLRVVSDETVNPTYTGDLAAAAVELAQAEVRGVVHAVAGGCCGWDDLARAVLAACGLRVEVESISTRDLALPAARPRNGCLASQRVPALRDWREGVRAWALRRPADAGARP
jgi:dTDP-4-dehydrorhamnose reductase